MLEIDTSHGPRWIEPREIYLRYWPMRRYESSRNLVFRWKEYGVSRELPVRIARKHSEIPMNSLQHQLWDEFRVQMALGEQPGERIYVAMTQFENGGWCQDHVFYFFMRDRDHVEKVIALHFDDELAELYTRNETEGYQDWRQKIRKNNKIIA